MSAQVDQYAVIGGAQVVHSKSPLIHHWFAEQTQQALSYVALDFAEDLSAAELLKALQALQAANFSGVNVTIPFKEVAYQALAMVGAQFSAGAEQVQATNTLLFTSQPWQGHNTDGIGLWRDLTQNLGWELYKQRILICGAGGAVRGILPALLQERPSEIVVANRTVTRAQALVALFAEARRPLTVVSVADLAQAEPFDLIINALPRTATAELPVKLLTPQTRCYDLVYALNGELTPFLAAIRAHQVTTSLSDGLGMLVEQAAESFAIWRGVRPQTQPVLARLREIS